MPMRAHLVYSTTQSLLNNAMRFVNFSCKCLSLFWPPVRQFYVWIELVSGNQIDTMAPHECHVNCRRFRGYGEPLTPDELGEFRRLRIELTPDDFQAYTSPYIRRLLFAYLSGKPMDDCLIFFNASTLDDAQFKRLIFTDCFNRKNVGTFRRRCAYEEKKYMCLHPDHYEFKWWNFKWWNFQSENQPKLNMYIESEVPIKIWRTDW